MKSWSSTRIDGDSPALTQWWHGSGHNCPSGKCARVGVHVRCRARGVKEAAVSPAGHKGAHEAPTQRNSPGGAALSNLRKGGAVHRGVNKACQGLCLGAHKNVIPEVSCETSLQGQGSNEASSRRRQTPIRDSGSEEGKASLLRTGKPGGAAENDGSTSRN